MGARLAGSAGSTAGRRELVLVGVALTVAKVAERELEQVVSKAGWLVFGKRTRMWVFDRKRARPVASRCLGISACIRRRGLHNSGCIWRGHAFW